MAECSNPSLDRSLSVHVITCNTVWQISKSRCPSTLSACAAPREVCSHERRGCHRYPTPAPPPSQCQIDSDVQKRVPSMILFTCLIGLKWVGGWGGYKGGGSGGGVGVIGGDTGWGVLFQRGLRALGVGADRWRKKKPLSHLTSLLYPSMRPRMSKVMKPKLQHKIAKNKPLLFALGAH